jgi:hypothetical protein
MLPNFRGFDRLLLTEDCRQQCPLEPNVNPNVAKIPYRRVGCAHQISLISFVKGGQSPPYNNNTGLHYG